MVSSLKMGTAFFKPISRVVISRGWAMGPLVDTPKNVAFVMRLTASEHRADCTMSSSTIRLMQFWLAALTLVNEAIFYIVQNKPKDQGIVTREDLELAATRCKDSDRAINNEINKRFRMFGSGVTNAWKTSENEAFLVDLCERYKYREPTPASSTPSEKAT